MSLKKRILNFTVIQHPQIDDAVADQVLVTVEQSCEEVFGLGLAPEMERLSPAAKRWRNEFVVRDEDTPANRLAPLCQFLEHLAENVERHALTSDDRRALARGQLIYSGMDHHRIQWGITITLNGPGQAQIHEQNPNGPLILQDPQPLLERLNDLRQALRSVPEADLPVEGASSVSKPRRSRRMGG